MKKKTDQQSESDQINQAITTLDALLAQGYVAMQNFRVRAFRKDYKDEKKAEFEALPDN